MPSIESHWFYVHLIYSNVIELDVNRSKIKATDVQHASVLRVSDRQTVRGQSAHYQLGEYSSFLHSKHSGYLSNSR